MVWDKKESWMELCELAAQEKDSKKLMALIGEIDRTLGSKASVCGEGFRVGNRESC
jgi:hypothetical protein